MALSWTQSKHLVKGSRSHHHQHPAPTPWHMKNLIVRRFLLHYWDLSVSIAQLVEDCEPLDKKSTINILRILPPIHSFRALAHKLSYVVYTMYAVFCCLAQRGRVIL